MAQDNRTLEEKVREQEQRRQQELAEKRAKLQKDRANAGASNLKSLGGAEPVKKKKKKKKSVGGETKSGLRKLEAGEVLFNEGNAATSLFIIQKGQLRLYRPKGKGYVELAILRTGQVLGEMAYFDDGARRRSCSAAAILETEIIEISFEAFGQTMQSLNPWFKTIIMTLANRLRTTNEKVKILETNSVAYGQDGHVAGYKFFHTIDIIRMLTLFYLVFRSHGKRGKEGTELSLSKLKFYAFEVFGVAEIKMEEFLPVMVNNNLVIIENDENNLPHLLVSTDINLFRSLMGFFSEQKMLSDDKKIQISSNCEIVLRKLIVHCDRLGMAEEEQVHLELNQVFKDLHDKGGKVDEGDLDDATEMGYCSEVMADGGKVTINLYLKKLRSEFLAIKVSNAINKINEAKSQTGSY